MRLSTDISSRRIRKLKKSDRIKFFSEGSFSTVHITLQITGIGKNWKTASKIEVEGRKKIIIGGERVGIETAGNSKLSEDRNSKPKKSWYANLQNLNFWVNSNLVPKWRELMVMMEYSVKIMFSFTLKFLLKRESLRRRKLFKDRSFIWQ